MTHPLRQGSSPQAADPPMLYLYAILPAERAAALDLSQAAVDAAEGGGALRILTRGRLAALVSDTATAQFQPRRRLMLAHTRILEGALAVADLLPAQFGTVAPDEGAVATLLETAEAELLEALEPLSGAVEFGLKAAWVEERIYRELVEGDAGLRRLRDQIQALPANRTYDERIELGRRIEAALNARRAHEDAVIRRWLAPLVRDVTAVAPCTDLQISNLAVLLSRDAVAEFENAIEGLDAFFQDLVTFKLIGPAPAYNFTRARLSFAAVAG